MLYVAGWSSPQNLSSDSTMSWVRGFVIPWVEATDDLFLFVTMPGGDYKSESVKAGGTLLEHPRIRPIWTLNDDKRQYREMTGFQTELRRFDDLHGDYPFLDAVLTDRPAALPQLLMETESYTRHGGWRRINVTSTQFLMDRISADTIAAPIKAAQALGWALADLNLWNTSDMRERALVEAKHWLSSAQVARIRDRSRVSLGGLQFGDVESSRLSVEERAKEPPTIVWGTAINSGYLALELLGEVDRLYAAGHPIRARVMTSSMMNEVHHRLREMLPERFMTWMEWYAQLRQRDFWKLASQGHVFLAGARQSDLSYGWAELAMLGLIGIYEDRPEIRATVVPGYPYFWTNAEHIRTWLRHLLVDGGWKEPEAQDWSAKQRAFVVDTFAGESNWPRVDAELRRLEAESSPGPKAGVYELIEKAVADTDELTLEQFSRRLAAFSKFGRRLENIEGGRYGQGKSVYRKVLLRLGWRDVCDAEEPRFVRE